MAGIYGLVRFSFVPSDPDEFKTSRGKEGGAIADTILSEERLETRFRLFETYTVPSLRAQTDPDFRVIVAASSLLSERWRDRLESAVASVPQIDLHFGEPQPVGQFFKRLLPETTPDMWRVTFRLDDDDGLATNFIERLRKIVRPAYQGMCVTMPKTMCIEDNGEKPRYFYGSWDAKHGVGLAYIGKPGERRTIYNIGGHSRVDEKCLTILDSRQFSCVRLFHSFNDHPYPPAKARKFVLKKSRVQHKFGHLFDFLFE